MQVDAEAGHLGEDRVVGEAQFVHDAGVRGIDGDRVQVHRHQLVLLLDDVPLALGGQGHAERLGDACGPGGVHGLVDADVGGGSGRRGHLRAVGHGVPGVLVGAGVRPGAELRGDGGGGPAEAVLELPDVLAGVLRPGQAGGGEHDESGDGPQADGSVPGQGAAAAGGLAVRKDQLRPALAAAAEPQGESTEGDHPHPARGELAVVPAELAELEAGVELAQPGPQRQRVADGGELPAHLGRIRVDEDGEGLALGEARALHDHPGGGLGVGGGPHGHDLALGGGTLGRVDLGAERQGALADAGDGQLVGVDDLLGLPGGGVEQPGGGGEEDQRGDKQPRVEVHAQQERSYGSPAAAAVLGRAGRFGVRGADVLSLVKRHGDPRCWRRHGE